MKRGKLNNLELSLEKVKICVVIPAYRVKSHILEVILAIGPEVRNIIVVDDNCPEMTGEFLRKNCLDRRVEVIIHRDNLGVGGAVKTGYRRSLELECDVVVKIDGDGQMDCSKIGDLVAPIIKGICHYTKGNRFYDAESVLKMPKHRIFGNLILSFMSKLSSGQWKIFDPNNGFTAISTDILRTLPLQKIDNGYFFESDMLFRLYLENAKSCDVAMPAIYGDEKSNIKLYRVLFEFPFKHLRNFTKRVLYTYYLRDFNLASIELPLGIGLSSFGVTLGLWSWIHGMIANSSTPSGTLILVAMSFLGGLQLLLAFFSYDSNSNSIRGD